MTAYVLAGGSSRRMGTDKLSIMIDGRSLLERTIDVCGHCFKGVKLVAGDAARFSSLDCPVVLDSPKARGPMAGVIAALEDCNADTCFVTAADLYDLSAAVVTRIVAEYSGQQYVGLSEARGLQPLCGIYHRSALELLHQRAGRSDFRMSEAVRSMDHSGVDLPSGTWRNINFPEDVAALRGADG